MEVIHDGRKSDYEGFTISMDFLEEDNIRSSGDFAEELDFD